MKQETIAILLKYFPEAAIDDVYYWLVAKKVLFRISKSRKTKLGDYKPPVRCSTHRISVNYDLNPYSFLITFVHELAHLLVYEKYGRRVNPHGFEWKTEYKILMMSFIKKEIFPQQLKIVLVNHIQKSKASSNSDLLLVKELKKYDKNLSGKHPEQTYLENLPFETEFIFGNDRRFIKLEKRRTRFLCNEISSGRDFLFHPLAEVVPLKKTATDTNLIV